MGAAFICHYDQHGDTTGAILRFGRPTLSHLHQPPFRAQATAGGPEGAW